MIIICIWFSSLRQPKNNEMKEGSVSYILNPNDLPKKWFPILGDGNK